MTVQDAVKEKELGNEAYKKKDFATAHTHYDKAIELDPTNVAFYNNKAAAFFEEGNLDECIKQSEKAVEVARETRADYKMIAKAFNRIANSHMKKGDEKTALVYFDKSVSEFRDPAVVTKRNEVAKIVKEKERLANIDPEKAQAEKELGNTDFKAGRYPDAVKHYGAAIKFDPNNAVLYSNRAACYTKLMEFGLALQDCEKCVRIDPKFIKGYIRMGAALMAQREYSRAKSAYEEALMIDPNNAEASAGLRSALQQTDESPEEARKKAMNDPEVQQILGDPAMRMILEQMQNDPASIKEHLQNPDILQKLMKLREAGIVQMR